MTRPNYSILSRSELLQVAYGLWEQIEELRREVEGLRGVKAAMEQNIEEKWGIIEANLRKG